MWVERSADELGEGSSSLIHRCKHFTDASPLSEHVCSSFHSVTQSVAI